MTSAASSSCRNEQCEGMWGKKHRQRQGKKCEGSEGARKSTGRDRRIRVKDYEERIGERF